MEPEIIHVLPDTPMSVLTLFETSKQGIERFSQSIITEIREGRIDPLRVRVLLKTIEVISDQIKDGTKNEAAREAGQYGDAEFTRFGAKISHGITSTKYAYESCGDPEWVELSAKLKAREALLKTLREPITVTIESTGEIVTVQPPRKNLTTGLKISIQ